MKRQRQFERFKMVPAINRVLVSLVLSLASALAAAQAGSNSKFTQGQVDVLDASSFLTSPSSSFKVDEDMMFVRSVAGRTHAHGKEVVLRIFPTQPGHLMPYELTTHPPCFIYLSTLQPLHFDGNGSFFVNHATVEWLTAVKDVGLTSSYFTFVFEVGDYTDFGTQFFRLFDADRKPYFDRGILVRIDPRVAPTPSNDVNKQADVNQMHWKENKKVADESNTPKLKCHIAHLAAAKEGDEEGAVLALSDDCDPLIP